MPAPKITYASLSNALKAAADAGLIVTGITLQPDGKVHLSCPEGAGEGVAQGLDAVREPGAPMTYDEAS